MDASGRTLSGQTTEAFYISLKHAEPFCIGLNCALGPIQMMPFLERLGKIAPHIYIHAYPNAGLPNALGAYDETPENFADNMEEFMKLGLVNMVGGCCGTTAQFMRVLVDRAQKH